MPAAPDKHYPDRLRLPLAFDPAALAADLARVEADEWTEHFVRQNYEGAWSVLPLRSTAGATHPVMMIYSDPAATAFEDTPFLARLPAMAAAIAAFACPLRSVRLMRLAAGSQIKEHCDPDLDAAMGFARIHVPVRTNPGVAFRLNGTHVPMAPGEAWYLRLSDRHSVVNRGSEDRVHLVIDAGMNPWLAGQLDAAAGP
jgi:hypothetical protein